MISAPGPAEQSSLPLVLATLYKRGFTGRLEVTEAGSDTSVVFFRRGRVVRVQRPDNLDALEIVLVQERLLPPRAVAEASRVAGADETQLALALGRTGVGEVVRAGLKVQLRRQLTRVFFAERPRLVTIEGQAAPGAGAIEVQAGTELDPRLLLFPAIRAAYDDARLARELAPLAGKRVRMMTAEGAFLREAGFPDVRDPALTVLRDIGVEVNDAWLRTPTDRKATPIKALVLAAHCLDLLQFGAPGGAAADRTPAPTPAAPRRRRTGITGLNVLEPAAILKMAEGFFKAGDVPRAERAFNLVLGSDATNPRARAYTAWIDFWKPETDRAKAIADTTKVVRDALRADPQFALAHHFLGVLLKQGNDLDGASRAFKAALAADATLVDAERELRLLTMRKAKA
jgi:hypothetical protein